jgi:hypothetical protein
MRFSLGFTKRTGWFRQSVSVGYSLIEFCNCGSAAGVGGSAA